MTIATVTMAATTATNAARRDGIPQIRSGTTPCPCNAPFSVTRATKRAIPASEKKTIRTGPTVVRSSGLAPLLARLTRGNSIRQMPLRNVLRAPRRALLTTLAIAAAIATLVGVIGIVDSFFATIDRGESAIIGSRPDRLTVDLNGFAIRGSEQLRAVTEAPGVQRAEPGLQVGGTLRAGHHHVDTLIALVDYRSPMWRPGTLSGHLVAGRPGIVIAEKAAHDLHVKVGDTIVVRHPLRQGLGYKLVDTRLRIQAIHDIPYRFIAFMDIRTAGIMNLDGIYNTVAVAPKAGTSLTNLQREMFALPSVGSVQPVLSFAETIRDMVNQVLDILRVVEGAVLLLALLIAFNSSAISVDERSRARDDVRLRSSARHRAHEHRAREPRRRVTGHGTRHRRRLRHRSVHHPDPAARHPARRVDPRRDLAGDDRHGRRARRRRGRDGSPVHRSADAKDEHPRDPSGRRVTGSISRPGDDRTIAAGRGGRRSRPRARPREPAGACGGVPTSGGPPPPDRRPERRCRVPQS